MECPFVDMAPENLIREGLQYQKVPSQYIPEVDGISPVPALPIKLYVSEH